MQGWIYLLLLLQATEGCTLTEDKQTIHITSYIGQSALLPCYCTDPLTEPDRFTWKKDEINGTKWAEISSESDQYRNRVQLFNDHSPGNLSLLISHLTEEDGGDYLCDVNNNGHKYVRLKVKGCVLQDDGQLTHITAYIGGSVLLPCYCTDLNKTSVKFSWKKAKIDGKDEENVSNESGQYRNRVQLFNDRSPTNLSLLISHLTEEDEKMYRCCAGEYASVNFLLKVKEPAKTVFFIPIAVMAMIFLHIIVAVVYLVTTRTKDPATVYYSAADKSVRFSGEEEPHY